MKVSKKKFRELQKQTGFSGAILYYAIGFGIMGVDKISAPKKSKKKK